MKKEIFLITFFLSSLLCFGSDSGQVNEAQNTIQSWQQEIFADNPKYAEYYKNIKIIKHEDGMISLAPDYYTEKIIKGALLTVQGQINCLTDVILNENGFLSFSFDSKDYYFLPDHQWAQMFPIGYIPAPMSIEKQKKTTETNRIYPEISNAKASSFLIEKTKNGICEYTPEYITDYNPFTGMILPWVEGVSGDGISEYIEFDVDNGTILYILNGYVDPAHPELFKNNGRLKKAELQVVFEDGTEDTIHVDFMDFVYYKEIRLFKRFKHVKLTIEEVYPGKKYKDTCISRIFTDFSFQL